MDKESYLVILSRYIHLNPVRTKEMEGASLGEKEKYLSRYRWSSLLSYVNDAERDSFVNYDTVLEAYGGNNDEGRRAYWSAICSDLSTGMDIKGRIVGQSILGSDKFVKRVKEKFWGDRFQEHTRKY